MQDRLSQLEDYSFHLADEITKLIGMMEAEFASSANHDALPFQDENKRAIIRAKMDELFSYTVQNRPAPSMTTLTGSGGTLRKASERKHRSSMASSGAHHTSTAAAAAAVLAVPEKIPFPRQHFEQLVLPPKRKQAPSKGVPEDETEEQRDLRLRDSVFNEILQTETDYIRDLGVLVGLYLRPLKNEYLGMVGEYDLKSMFKNVETILEVNSRLLAKLEEQEALPPKEQKIGAVFVSMLEEFSNYDPYCTNQVSSEETVQKMLKENPRFAEFAEEVRQMEESHNLEIQTFLMKPFQRICRYPLLLKELQKRTPSDWPDFKAITSAMDGVNIVMQGANETKRVTDSMLKVFDIQQKLIGASDVRNHSQLYYLRNHSNQFYWVYFIGGLITKDA
jgi:hypothetical protein